MQPSQIESKGKDDSVLPTVVLPTVVLFVGGLDPGGGAGLVRDVLTAAALGARPLVVGTAWTEQGPGIHGVEPRDAGALRDSLRHALTARPAAVKIGMVPDVAHARAILEGLQHFGGPIVFDPVLASSRGGPLFRGEARELRPLLQRSSLATPNTLEAAALTGLPVANLEEAANAALALVAQGLEAVLIKGGHLGGAHDTVTDTLLVGADMYRLPHARVGVGDVRGTGCALATAIAVHLGRGEALRAAVIAATAWLERALAASVDVGGERHLG